MSDRPANWPLQSFDAKDWAEAFVDAYENIYQRVIDEGWMLTWFANALMRGFDEANRRRDVQDREFIGWLSADIPELHRVSIPALYESYQQFLRRSDEDARSASASAPTIETTPSVDAVARSGGEGTDGPRASDDTAAQLLRETRY